VTSAADASPDGSGVEAHAEASSPVTAAPFTMLPGDASAMICDGDVCYVPVRNGA
jgi:hypothetical protein